MVITVVEMEGNTSYLLKFAPSPDTEAHARHTKTLMLGSETYTVCALVESTLGPAFMDMLKLALPYVKPGLTWVVVTNGKVMT